VDPGEADALASRFRFAAFEIPTVGDPPRRGVREVHPSLEHLAAWISSVGGSVTLHDLDGDGLGNDLCTVETSTDRILVCGVPSEGERYAPFVLDASPLFYDGRTTAPMGTVAGDFDEDGRADVLAYYWGRPPVLFLRRGEGALAGDAYERRELTTDPIPWFTNAATSADVDGDGHVDLLFGNYFQDGAAILDGRGARPQRMQHSMSRALNGGRNRLFLWQGPGEFRDASDAFEGEWAHGWTLALGAADLDGDLLPEIYIANDFGPDRLLHNRSTPGRPRFALLEGKKTLTTPSSKVLGRDSFKGMGVDFADVNGDGRLDIYVSNIAAEYALEESHFLWVGTGDPADMARGIAPFRDESEGYGVSRSGWGWDTRLADFDNDGVLEAVQATGFVRGTRNRWPELHELAMGNDDLLRFPASWPRFRPGDDLSGHQPIPFFAQSASGRYVDVAADVGLGRPQIARGLATGDVDGDGDLDLAVGSQWEPSRFYRNDAPGRGASLVLYLVRPPDGDALSVRPGPPGPDTPGAVAVGAEVRASRPDGTAFIAQVDGGNGHSGDRSPEIHLGLGVRPRAGTVPVTVRWRDRAGRVREAALEFLPGVHTVSLGRLPGETS
jgi:hypothetical protein